MADSPQQADLEATRKHYFLRDHNVNGSEWDRLDELHNGFCQYMQGNLTFASLEDPKRILDIGAGSGAWAIQAAQTYPNAEVIAADISPLPMRPLPPKVKYVYCDILKPLPFEKDSFDVVHIRIVLYHLPEIQIPDVIERVSHIIKPSGWLIIEDFGRHTGHSASPGPAQLIFDNIFIGMLREKGLDPTIGEHLGNTLQNADIFEEINTKKIELILSTNQNIPGISFGEQDLSNAVRLTIEKVVMMTDISEDLRSAGITPEVQMAWLEERKDPNFRTYHDVWFTWSRKRKTPRH